MKRPFSNDFFRRCVQLIFLFPLVGLHLLASSSFPVINALPSQPDPPDPLKMLDGKQVVTRKQWFQQRRPELKALFEHYMYGTMPPAPTHPDFKIERVNNDFLGGKATEKEVTIHFDANTNTPSIHLLLVIPQDAHWGRGDRHAFPVFLGLNSCGNHTLVTDTNITLSTAWMSKSCPGCVDNRATEASRGTQVDVWALEQSIDRGYAVATFYCGDIEPDLTNAPYGLREWLAKDQTKSPTSDCGTIEAWAWGLSRAVDYLVTDESIDAKRIAVTGHSRLGKAAVLAAAFDERIALAVPLQAGCGGTSPSRGKVGESVKAINDRFPHWFNSEFKKFNEQPDRLPIDQNCLIAMIAPRPVLIGCARGDSWSNPAGQFQMLEAADPVYHLLGVDGLEEKQMPETGRLVGKRLAYFIRPGKHSMTRGDWKMFLDFADKAMP